MIKEWKEFVEGDWYYEINVSNFIKLNYKEYKGNESFLSKSTKRTQKVWNKCVSLLKEEQKLKVLNIDTEHVSGINNYDAGYIDKDNEVIVGLQTDEPLKRIINPYGGIRMVNASLEAYGYKLNKDIDTYFNMFRKTHNKGVFDDYTEEIRTARRVGLLTGLPDAYGRGRIIGDYRRIALYGIDRLVEEKKRDLEALDGPMSEDR